MPGKRIAVVGAGIAGLTAAHFLKEGGHEPLVLERSARVGGRVISEVVDGFTIDWGAQFLSDRYPILTGVIEKLGLRPQLVETSQYYGTVRSGSVRKVRNSELLSPLRSGLLGVPGWLRLGVQSRALHRQVRSLPFSAYAAWSDRDDRDAESWSRSFLGDEITTYVTEPIIGGLFFQSLDRTSRALAESMISIFISEKAKYLTLAGGIGVLPERLAAALDVRRSAPVTAIDVGETGVELHVGSERIVADGVVLATTATAARELYSPRGTVERELLSTQYNPSITVAVAAKDPFRVPPRLEGIFGFLVPERERLVIASMTNERFKHEDRLAGGQLLELFLSGPAAAEMIGWADDRILPVVLDDLERYFPGVSRNVLFTRMYRWREAMPMTPRGRSRNVAAYRGTIAASARVVLAGDYLGMPMTEGAAETGRWAAETIAKNLS